MIRHPLLVLTLLLIGAPSAYGAMIIDRAIITFTADGSSREDVLVVNPDPDPLYLEVEVLEVKNPGTEEETRTVVSNPEELGLIASPRRTMIPSDGQRTIRLVALKPPGEQEQVYRVNMRPTAGDVQSDTMAIKILLGYQLLIFVEPETINIDIDIKREGNKLKLENRGNVNVRVHDLVQCEVYPMPPEDCDTINGTRLYPGNQVTLDLPYDNPLTLQLSAAGQISTRQID